MYAHSHAVGLHGTQEYIGLATVIRSRRLGLTHAMLFWTLQNISNSNELKEIFRVWHEE